MREKLTVIKVGGKIVEEEATLRQLLNDFAAIEGHKVLVHGGGRSATKIAAQLGIESKMVNGRRITDAETLKVVTMVYGGLVNKNIVAGLQAYGVNALGLTGADMNVIRSVKRPVKEVDYGFVGDVEKVDASLLSDLIYKGVVPVMDEPYVEQAKFASDMRTYYWNHRRGDNSKRDCGIHHPNTTPYPKPGTQYVDVPNQDGGGNFGRIARVDGLMVDWVNESMDTLMAGIEAKYWVSFFKLFSEVKPK